MKRLSFYMLFLVSLLSACGQEETASSQVQESEKAIPVRTAEVRRERHVAPIRVSGVVSTDSEARPAFKTGGVIARIFVEEGATVRKGQLMATLNLTEIQAQVQQAKEGVDKARRDLQRARNLYADSVATLEQVQDATTAMTVAEKNLEMASFNQNYSEIRAPFDGKLIKKLMNEGEVTGPGTPVFYLLSSAKNDWVVRAGLSDRDWARLKSGNRARIQLDAYPGQVFEAKISQLADVGNPQSGTFDAEFAFTGPTPRLAIGLVASVEILPEAAGEQAIIPIDALVEANGSSAVVFVLNNDQTVSRVPVTIGQIHQDMAIIISGLEKAGAVVTTGAPYLEDGRKVKVIP